MIKYESLIMKTDNEHMSRYLSSTNNFSLYTISMANLSYLALVATKQCGTGCPLM